MSDSDIRWIKETLVRIENAMNDVRGVQGVHTTRITILEDAETRRKWWVGVGVTTGLAAIAKVLWG